MLFAFFGLGGQELLLLFLVALFMLMPAILGAAIALVAILAGRGKSS
jgi:hypothetical protein